ncbi:unnamed protein product, partial [Vitis vinifera]
MRRSSSRDENHDLGYRLPYTVDHFDRSTAHSSTPSARSTAHSSTPSADSISYMRTYSQSSNFSDRTEDNSSYSYEASASAWPVARIETQTETPHKQAVWILICLTNLYLIFWAELELMKERFSKLLLGEDMSGSGKGVCTAVTISNAITNLYATIFGQNQKLEPLSPEKKSMWKREMNCLLAVCDYMVEFFPSLQTLPNGTSVEVMASRPRSDIHINLPALQKLDTMLQEILDSFKETEFWYAEQGKLVSATRAGSFRLITQRPDEKWWLPVPCIPRGGLSEKARKDLKHTRDCANQIHKAAMSINSSLLAEMKIPDSYIAALPKSGRAGLGDAIYRFMNTSDKFSPDQLMDYLHISSEHEALELADRVEASMYTWRRKACVAHSKSSWDMVKQLISETERTDKNYVLAERAESLLFCLKQRYPELSQTSLDACKIQYNKDVGQAILESYSRVLESLAFSIVAWIEDVLHEDRNMRCKERSVVEDMQNRMSKLDI